MQHDDTGARPRPDAAPAACPDTAADAPPLGHLHLVTGPMFAGKSSTLIRAASGKGGALVMKPAFDTRDGHAVISSRDQTRADALPISRWPADAAAAPILVLDEVQFLVPPHYDGDIVADLAAARARGARITAGGLDTDYHRKPFAVIERLAALADRHDQLAARCHACGRPAHWTAKMRETGALLELGDDELYEARCDLHWTEPGR